MSQLGPDVGWECSDQGLEIGLGGGAGCDPARRTRGSSASYSPLRWEGLAEGEFPVWMI
jgi:hypothetical protein